MTRLALPLSLVLALATLAACGDAPGEGAGDGPGEDSSAEAVAVPDTPDAALAWLRETAEKPAALRRRLAAWPVDDEVFRFTDENQVALTWRIRVAVDDGEIVAALEDLGRLREDYEGEGLSPEGRSLDARVMALGVFEEALSAAREAVFHAQPDPGRADDLTRLAETLLLEQDAEDRTRVQGLRKLLLAEKGDALLYRFGLSGLEWPEDAPARVVALADDWSLGEVRFTDVLSRWRRQGAHVVVAPVLRGQVRVGSRLLPADSETDELTSMGSRLRHVGLRRAGEEDHGVLSETVEALGLGPQEVVVLVMEPRGRIVGRIAGINPDLRALDPVLQRLVSR